MLFGWTKSGSGKKDKMEGIDECTRQIVAANMTMMVSMSNQLSELKQLELEHNKQLADLINMFKKD